MPWHIYSFEFVDMVRSENLCRVPFKKKKHLKANHSRKYYMSAITFFLLLRSSMGAYPPSKTKRVFFCVFPTFLVPIRLKMREKYHYGKGLSVLCTGSTEPS